MPQRPRGAMPRLPTPQKKKPNRWARNLCKENLYENLMWLMAHAWLRYAELGAASTIHLQMAACTRCGAAVDCVGAAAA